LTETLSTFMTQRSKALQQLLGRKAEYYASSKVPSTTDGVPKPSSSAKLNPKTRKAAAREIHSAIAAVLDLMSGTVSSARSIFQSRTPSEPSLIHRVLDYIQQDEASPTATTVPLDLQLSTARFLATLPSAAHFLLLPATLRAYKPHVDLTSASATVPQPALAARLDQWFKGAAEQLRSTAAGWLAGARNVREVWAVRTWVRQGVEASERMSREEQENVIEVMDDVCRGRAVQIWVAKLEEIEENFSRGLQMLVKGLEGSGRDVSGQTSHLTVSCILNRLFP
jgi:hypothetical protein